MATTPGDKQTKKFESFSEKFPVGVVIDVPELRMTAAEGFCIKDLSDMENSQASLVCVKNLTISDNILSRLRLRNFNNLDTIDASRNMIGEVILCLQNLKILNLSYNLISKIFDLKDLPNLQNLNLSFNIIEKITVKDLIGAKNSLHQLDLSYNKINFEAYEFITFFEGLKNFKIKNFKIKDNIFTTKNPSLRNNYKVYISLCIKTLEMIDGEAIKIDPSIGNIDELANLILIQAADYKRHEVIKKLESESQKILLEQLKVKSDLLNQKEEKEKHKKESLPNKKINDSESEFDLSHEKEEEIRFTQDSIIVNREQYEDIINIINRIIKNLNDIFMAKYDFQILYLKIIDDLLLLISNKFYPFTNQDGDYEMYRYIFKNLLNKLLLLMDNIDEKEELTIIKMIPKLLFIEYGFFSEICFSFFKSLMLSSITKKDIMGQYVKEAIKHRLSEIIDQWKDFTILKHITEFFDDEMNIDIDDILNEHILDFLKIFEKIWKNNEIGYDYYGDNEEIYDNKTYQLMITSIKLLKKYFEMQIKKVKSIQKSENMYFQKLGNSVYANQTNALGANKSFSQQMNNSFNSKNKESHMISDPNNKSNNNKNNISFKKTPELTEEKKSNKSQRMNASHLSKKSASKNNQANIVEEENINKNPNLNDSMNKSIHNSRAIILPQNLDLSRSNISGNQGMKIYYNVDEEKKQKQENSLMKNNNLNDSKNINKPNNSMSRKVNFIHLEQKILEDKGENNTNIGNTEERKRMQNSQINFNASPLHQKDFEEEAEEGNINFKHQSQRNSNVNISNNKDKQSNKFITNQPLTPEEEKSFNNKSIKINDNIMNSSAKFSNNINPRMPKRKENNLKKAVTKQSNPPSLFNKSFYKLDGEGRLNLFVFEHIYSLMTNKINQSYIALSSIENEDDLELFHSFLDFSSLVLQNIESIRKNNLFNLYNLDNKDDSKLNSKEVKLENILKVNAFRDCLLNLIDPLLKRIKIEEDPNDNVDLKIEGLFVNYLVNYQEKNSDNNNSVNESSIMQIKEENKYKKKNPIKLFSSLTKIKEFIIEIFRCIASTFRLAETGTVQQIFESERIKKIIALTKKTSNIDPYLLEASCAFTIVLLGDPKTKNDYVTFFSLINRNENFLNLRNLFDLIDIENKTFQEFVNFLFSKCSRKKTYITDYNFEKLQGIQVYLKRILRSIILLFKKLAKYVSLDNITIKKAAQDFGEMMKKNLHFRHLGNCLKIKDDVIRLNAVKTLFLQNMGKNDLDIMDEIMKIVSEYDSVTEGQTELILSIVYLLFNKIVCTQMNKNENLTQKNILRAIDKSFDFLKKNLNRNPIDEAEIEQKNDLAISIILFLSSISRFSFRKEEYYKYLENMNNPDHFLSIMELDYLYYTPETYLPVEIERTIIGSRVKNYIDIIRGSKSINPYSFNFIRIVLKIADILCDIPEYSLPFALDLKIKNIKFHLYEHIKKKFLFRLFNESQSWEDFITNLDHSVADYDTIGEYIAENEEKKNRISFCDNEEDLNINSFKFTKINKINREIEEKLVHKLNAYMKINIESVNKNSKNMLILKMIHEILNIRIESLDEKSKEDDGYSNLKTPSSRQDEKGNKIKNNSYLKEGDSKKANFNQNKNPKENYVMDYLHQVYLIYKAKKEKKSNNKYYDSKYYVQGFQHVKPESQKYAILYDHINFLVLFPNLLNILLGKIYNYNNKNIYNDLMNKFDQNILHNIKYFSNFKKVSDLNQYKLVNINHLLNETNLKTYIKENFFDNSEKDYLQSIKAKKAANLELQSSIMSVNPHKNSNLLFDNFKENFFANCLNFSKKIFSKYFFSKNKSHIYWKNEIPYDFEWKNITSFKRIANAEDHNNSNVRSLLISGLLRCVYTLFKSYSKNITKKFIEILFSQNIYYDFFLYISSGLYMKYNIGQKILNIIILLLGKNFGFIKDHFKSIYFVSGEMDKPMSSSKQTAHNNDAHNKTGNNNPSKSNYFNNIQLTNAKETLPENEFKYYIKLLEFINICSIFIKKIYNCAFLEKNIQYSANHNFINIFFNALNSLMNCIINSNFPEIFKNAIDLFAVNNIIQNNIVKNILPYISMSFNLNKRVSKIIYKKILLMGSYAQIINLFPQEIDEELFGHLLLFKFYLEKNRKTFITTIANLKYLCKENKNIFLKELISYDIDDYNSQLIHKCNSSNSKTRETISKEFNDFDVANNPANAKTPGTIPESGENKTKPKVNKFFDDSNVFNKICFYKGNFSNKSVNNEQKGKTEENKKEKSKKDANKKEKKRKEETNSNDNNSTSNNPKFTNLRENLIKEIYQENCLIELSIELQKMYFPDESRILINKCELEIVNQYSKMFGLLILTDKHIFIFELDEIQYKNNLTHKIKEESHYMKFLNTKILDLRIFDYSTRLIFEYKRKENQKLEDLFMRIKRKLKSTKFPQEESKENNNNNNHDNNMSYTNVNNENPLSENPNHIEKVPIEKEYDLEDLKSKNTLNVDVEDIKAEIDKLNDSNSDQNIKKNDSISEIPIENRSTFGSFFSSNIFGKKPEIEDKNNLFFSVSLKNIFDATNLYSLLTEFNSKFKSNSDNGKFLLNFLEGFILVYEKNYKTKFMKETNIFNAEHFSKDDNDFDLNEDNPIFLEEAFKKEELNFIKNEFKIKNNFAFNQKYFINALFKKFNSCVVSFNNDKLFSKSNNSCIINNRAILFLAHEYIYLLTENFENMKSDDFVDSSHYFERISNKDFYQIIKEINYNHMNQISFENSNLKIGFNASKSKEDLVLTFNDIEEGEFIYLYLMKKTLLNLLSNKNKKLK